MLMWTDFDDYRRSSSRRTPEAIQRSKLPPQFGESFVLQDRLTTLRHQPTGCRLQSLLQFAVKLCRGTESSACYCRISLSLCECCIRGDFSVMTSLISSLLWNTWSVFCRASMCHHCHDCDDCPRSMHA